MLDENTAGTGHNQPPAFDPDKHAEHAGTVSQFLDASQVWLKMDRIETDEHAGQLTDQIDGLRSLYKKVDETRKTEKKPHDDAGKAVQAAYSPMLTKLKKAADDLKPKLGAYAALKAEQAAKEKAAAEAEAQRLADEAEAERAAAEKSGNISDQVDAEEKVQAAAKAQKAATADVKMNVKSATGAGRTMSLRTVKEVQVENDMALFMSLRSDPEVQDVLLRVATRRVRAAGYADGEPLRGITITEKKVMA